MAAGDGPLARMSVLVVEDTWHIAEVMRRALVKAGAGVIGPAGTLAEAERLANTGEFDAAVLDLNLGDEDRAHDLACRLFDRGVKVVLLTAYALPPALADKVHAYLPKPAKPRDLIEALQRVSGR